MESKKGSQVKNNQYIGTVYVGIDVHRKSYAVAILVEGAIIMKKTMPADSEALVCFLKRTFPLAKIHSVYEAGFCGYGLHRKLVANDITNLVVNPASVQIASRDKVKTDQRDASKLAEHLAAGFLKGIRIRSPEEEYNRLGSRLRETLLKDRKRFMVRARMKLHEFDLLPLEHTGVLTYAYVQELIHGEQLHPMLKQTLQAYLRIWKVLDENIRVQDKAIKEEAKTNSCIQTYMEVPGIGMTTAKYLFDELGDLQQFKNEKSLFSFLGLTPCEFTSGDKVRRGHISRQGNPTLRAKLTECSWIAIGKDPVLKKSFSKIAARQGAKKATLAIVRKLIGRARALFRTKKEYELNYNSVTPQNLLAA